MDIGSVYRDMFDKLEKKGTRCVDKLIGKGEWSTLLTTDFSQPIKIGQARDAFMSS